MVSSAGGRSARCVAARRDVTVHTMGPIDGTRSPHARLRPLDGARIDGGFWAARQRLNRERLLPDGERRLEEAGNFDNLRAAAGRSDAGFRGMVFMGFDVHRWLQAPGWEARRDTARGP